MPQKPLTNQGPPIAGCVALPRNCVVAAATTAACLAVLQPRYHDGGGERHAAHVVGIGHRNLRGLL